MLDGSDAHKRWLEGHPTGWRQEIKAVTAFIDRDNINRLIGGAGIEGDIGILSIDLDGNDLWILEAIDVVSPRILILEYNATFGPEAAVTVPYDPSFVRGEKHSSNLYWGASLAALTRTAKAKGFSLVGSNRAGNNAFYVRDDVVGRLPVLEAADAWRPSRFRESRGPAGELTYVSDRTERLRLMRDMPVHDLDAGGTVDDPRALRRLALEELARARGRAARRCARAACAPGRRRRSRRARRRARGSGAPSRAGRRRPCR